MCMYMRDSLYIYIYIYISSMSSTSAEEGPEVCERAGLEERGLQ